MNLSDIILDNFTGSISRTSRRGRRFYGGINIHILRESTKDYQTLHCCSVVKTTTVNWSYFIDPTVDIELITSWIEEISPMFPALKIRVVYRPLSQFSSLPYSYDYTTGIIPLIVAEYSKKSYPVEAYLAHHLIRACLSDETIPYIKQYFLIKKSTPDLYFWNRIFLCQFGFNMYYYFWLTDRRFFNLTTKEEFEKKARDYSYTSSFDFFEYFRGDFPIAFRKKMSELYLKGQFDLIISNLKLSKYVTPTDAFKKKSKNFLYSVKYKVGFEDEENYYITGDNYLQRKYPKTNFNIVEE